MATSIWRYLAVEPADPASTRKAGATEAGLTTSAGGVLLVARSRTALALAPAFAQRRRRVRSHRYDRKGRKGGISAETWGILALDVAAQHGHFGRGAAAITNGRGNHRNTLKTYCPKGYADDTARPYVRHRDCRACSNEATEHRKNTAPSRQGGSLQPV